MARRSTGRRKKLNKSGGCGGKGYAGFGRKIKIKGYKRRKPGAPKSAKKTVSVRGSSYCSSRKVSKTSTKGKPCYTKTGLKKSALKSGKCPSGTNRSKARKAKAGGAARGRRAGSGFVCVSKSTGRWTKKVAGGKCRKGSKRSRRF